LAGSALVALAGWSAVTLAGYAVGLVRAGPPEPSVQLARIIDEAASDGMRVVESRSVDARGTGDVSRLLVLRSPGKSDELRMYDLRDGRLTPKLRFRPVVPSERSSNVWIRIAKVDDLDGNGAREVIAHLTFPAQEGRDLAFLAYPVMILWDWARNEHALVPLLGAGESRKGVLKLAKLRHDVLADEDIRSLYLEPTRFADTGAGIDFRAHAVQTFDVRRTDAGAFLVGGFLVGGVTAPAQSDRSVLMAAQVRFWRIQPWRLDAPVSACDGVGRILRVRPEAVDLETYLITARLGGTLNRAFRGFSPSACL